MTIRTWDVTFNSHGIDYPGTKTVTTMNKNDKELKFRTRIYFGKAFLFYNFILQSTSITG